MWILFTVWCFNEKYKFINFTAHLRLLELTPNTCWVIEKFIVVCLIFKHQNHNWARSIRSTSNITK